MIGALKNWYFALSRREQQLMSVAAALVGLLLIGYALSFGWNLVSSAGKEMDEAVQRRGRIEARLLNPGQTAVAAKNAAPAFASDQPLETFVTSSAEAAGFEVAQSTARGDRELSLRIASIKAGLLMAWLSQLERQGLQVYELQLRKADGGFVSADIGLRK